MSYRILLLSHSHEALDDISRTLEMAGIGVKALRRCGTCREALAVLAEGGIDLIFADHDLRVMESRTCGDWDRCVHEIERPVIVMSNRGHRTMIEGFILKGETKVFRRPVNPDVIDEVIRRVSDSP